MSIPDPFDAPESAAETLPNVQACYALCACVKCSTDLVGPNPYRFTVEVFRLPFFHRESEETWTVVLHLGDEWSDAVTDEFPTKEEADTHAALILAALHEAVME